MKHTEKYLQAKWVTENPDGYDERDVIDAKRYCNTYLEGYNQALSIANVVGQSEQLVCDCGKHYHERDLEHGMCHQCWEPTKEPNVQNAKIEYNEYISSKLHDLLPNNKKEAIAFLNKEIESLFELNALSSDFIEIIIVKEKISIVNYFCKKVRNLHWGLDGTAY